MQYQMIPVGEIWQEGMITLPKTIVTKYLKLASEKQIKALLLILSSNGTSDSKELSKALNCTEEDTCELLEFWVEEGLLSCDGKINQQPKVPSEKAAEKPIKRKKEKISAPVLSRSDLLLAMNENAQLSQLMQDAQEVLGSTLSHADQELIANMVTYYGLPVDVVLCILQYYKDKKNQGVAIGTSYISAMAKNWSEEGIVTLEAADEKLKELESSDILWKEIIAISGIKHRNPTVKQRDMIARWKEDFTFEMISLACDIMKENTDKPALKYVDAVLKNWKKKGIFTPEAVEQEEKERRENKVSDKSKIDKTYDLDEISRRAMMNDNYNI